jgi:hypothetical protein
MRRYPKLLRENLSKIKLMCGAKLLRAGRL